MIVLQGQGNLEWLEMEESNTAPLAEFTTRLNSLKTEVRAGQNRQKFKLQ
jgi:hypothetical protein